MPVEMYPLPGPKRPIRIRYVVMSLPILELSAVLSVKATTVNRQIHVVGLSV